MFLYERVLIGYPLLANLEVYIDCCKLRSFFRGLYICSVLCLFIIAACSRQYKITPRVRVSDVMKALDFFIRQSSSFDSHKYSTN